MGSCVFIVGTNFKAVLMIKFTDNSALGKSHLDFPPYQLRDLLDVDGMWLSWVVCRQLLFCFREVVAPSTASSVPMKEVVGKVSAFMGTQPNIFPKEVESQIN